MTKAKCGVPASRIFAAIDAVCLACFGFVHDMIRWVQAKQMQTFTSLRQSQEACSWSDDSLVVTFVLYAAVSNATHSVQRRSTPPLRRCKHFSASKAAMKKGTAEAKQQAQACHDAIEHALAILSRIKQHLMLLKA
jgi:hypothetical protein